MSMNYIENINKGVSYILKSQNPDGGLAIGDIGNDESGVWTTAESLDALLSTNVMQINLSTLDKLIKIVLYLISNFIVDKNNDKFGYWEIANGDGPSTLATGHTIYSLQVFLNKVFSNCDINALSIAEKKYNIQDIRENILLCINKGTNWLINNQQADNGWSQSPKDEEKNSSPLCTYYVLRGLNSVGKNYYTDVCVEQACIYVKSILYNLLTNTHPEESDFSNLLYGYMCLNKSEYFSKGDEKFKKQIHNYIFKHWNDIKKYVHINELSHGTVTFVYNVPYIALITLLSSEEYILENKIQELIHFFIDSQAINGSWVIFKVSNDGNKIKETTWVTAEAVIALNEAQQKYIKYRDNIKNPRQNKKLYITTAILSFLCIFMFSCYFIGNAIATKATTETLPNVLITILGLASSIITILEAIKK